VNIALFGGTFDPIHSGHLKAAVAAARKFELDRILFVPTGNPPHKNGRRLTPYVQRYAMVALACAGDRRFVPSRLEAPACDGHIHYSVLTVQRFRKSLRPGDRLYFILGADSFLDLPNWREYARLLSLANLIVVSRPGFEAGKIPQEILALAVPGGGGGPQGGVIRLKKTGIHILKGVEVPVASREIREAVRDGQTVTGLVPPLVEQYIAKEGLYRLGSGRRPQ
jgi:nicotinate-nucleotide adenylyltransferase